MAPIGRAACIVNLKHPLPLHHQCLSGSDGLAFGASGSAAHLSSKCGSLDRRADGLVLMWVGDSDTAAYLADNP